MTERFPSESTESQLPEELAEQLRRRYAPAIEIPAAVDDAVLRDAERHLLTGRPVPAQSTEHGRFAWKFAITVTTAALLLVAGLWQFQLTNSNAPAAASVAETRGGRVAGNPDDVNGDGQVDILDAFALARLVDNGTDVSAGHDRDRDGTVSRADVDLLAGDIVML